jgi:hypothetical protein
MQAKKCRPKNAGQKKAPIRGAFPIQRCVTQRSTLNATRNHETTRPALARWRFCNISSACFNMACFVRLGFKGADSGECCIGCQAHRRRSQECWAKKSSLPKLAVSASRRRVGRFGKGLLASLHDRRSNFPPPPDLADFRVRELTNERHTHFDQHCVGGVSLR